MAASPKKPMTQSELIRQISALTNIQGNAIKDVVIAIQHVLKLELKTSGIIRLFDLGKFKVQKVKARNGINPFTKQKVKIPAKKRVRFVVSRAFAEAVLETSRSVHKKNS
ncbi:HU family DNA-binding protein [[Mycoplasma] testudinis]|uniref:HU family DNA-binding protein n=1 Tax=[Mycoplasma] testudinis TaxID=33924 RepID=UPI0006970528|nr:HU family DNA-binding protein [[Mycoplasma] testudinis]